MFIPTIQTQAQNFKSNQQKKKSLFETHKYMHLFTYLNTFSLLLPKGILFLNEGHWKNSGHKQIIMTAFYMLCMENALIHWYNFDSSNTYGNRLSVFYSYSKAFKNSLLPTIFFTTSPKCSKPYFISQGN